MVFEYLVKFLNSQASTSIAGFLILFVSIITIYYHRKTAKERFTFECLRQLDTDIILINAQNLLQTIHFDDRVSLELIATSEEIKHKKLKQELRHLLNYFESLAIGCKIGIYDKRTIILSSNQQIINTYKYSLPYIKMLRKELKNRNIFVNLESFAQELQKLNNK